jgi:hypothetical protein
MRVGVRLLKLGRGRNQIELSAGGLGRADRSIRPKAGKMKELGEIGLDFSGRPNFNHTMTV